MGAIKARRKKKLNIVIKKEAEVVEEKEVVKPNDCSSSFSGSHSSAFSSSENDCFDEEHLKDKLILSHEECLKIVLKDP